MDNKIEVIDLEKVITSLQTLRDNRFTGNVNIAFRDGDVVQNLTHYENDNDPGKSERSPGQAGG